MAKKEKKKEKKSDSASSSKKEKKDKSKKVDEIIDEAGNIIPKLPGVYNKELILYSNNRLYNVDLSFLVDYEPSLIVSKQITLDNSNPINIVSALENSFKYSMPLNNENVSLIVNNSSAIPVYSVPNGYEIKPGKSWDLATNNFIVNNNNDNLPFSLQQVSLKREMEVILRMKSMKKSLPTFNFIIDSLRTYPRSLSINLHCCNVLSTFFTSSITTRDDCKRANCDCPNIFSPPRDALIGVDRTMEPESNRLLFIESNGLDLLWNVLNLYSNQMIVSISVFDILSQLCTNTDFADLIIRRGFIDRATTVLKFYLPASSSNKPQYLNLLVDAVLTFIWNLLSSSSMTQQPLFSVPASTTPLNLDVAKMISGNKVLLDLLKNSRRLFESSALDHRIVERAYNILIYSAPTQEFAGADPYPAVDIK